MSGSSVRMYRATLRANSAPPKLVVVEAECLSPDERTAFALLSSRVAAVALRGAGYENEAAADMVFKPRSSGGLAAAIEYACRLVA